MTGSQRSTRRKHKGQGLVEFALVLPILLLLIMGVIDFGWMIFNYTQLYNGLREGLRYGSTRSFVDGSPNYYDCDGIRQRIITLAGTSGVQIGNISLSYDNGDSTVNVGNCPPGAGFIPGPLGRQVQNGDRLVITIDRNVPFLTPIIANFAKSGIRMYFKAARTLYPDGVPLNAPSS